MLDRGGSDVIMTMIVIEREFQAFVCYASSGAFESIMGSFPVLSELIFQDFSDVYSQVFNTHLLKVNVLLIYSILLAKSMNEYDNIHIFLSFSGEN